jgi:hypothetical protein
MTVRPQHSSAHVGDAPALCSKLICSSPSLNVREVEVLLWGKKEHSYQEKGIVGDIPTCSLCIVAQKWCRAHKEQQHKPGISRTYSMLYTKVVHVGMHLKSTAKSRAVDEATAGDTLPVSSNIDCKQACYRKAFCY